MAQYDFFDLTELPFDPPEKKFDKINRAIQKTIEKLRGQQGSASQDAERQEIAGKLKYLEEMQESLSRDNSSMVRMAAEKTAAVKQRLSAAVELTKIGKQTFLVTIGAIKAQKRKTRLSQKSVESVYQEKGFTIVQTNPLSAYPKFPTNAENLYNELARLRTTKDPNPNGPDTSKVENLYAFAAYISLEPENVAEYRTWSTPDLARLLSEYGTRNAARNDPLGKLCNSIASKGKAYVFNNEENRRAYDQYLLYKNPNLSRLFTLLRDVTETEKRTASFADNCVREIAKVFGDSEVALAIYNKEANLQDDPYFPETAAYFVPCARCGSLCQFPTFQEAHRVNRCTQCGAALFKPCPRCKKFARASLERCPECGFIFNNAGQVSKYMSLAENALLRGDVDEARRNLSKAKSADPDGTASTTDLEQRIERKVAEFDGPRRKLRELMGERKYMKAAQFLPQIKREYPGINVAEEETAVRRMLEDCRTRFRSIRALSQRDAVQICYEILSQCKDFAPALDYLRETPPPPVNLRTLVNCDDGTVTLNWSRCGEPKASYCVVRRIGSVPPQIPQDGQMMYRGAGSVSWQDTDISAGHEYAYSVFSFRDRTGIYSTPASASVKTLFNVRDVQCRQNEDSIHLSWFSPSGCQSVSIARRVDGGSWSELGTSVGGYFDDRDVRRGSLYHYLLTAKYEGIGNAPGVRMDFRPTAIISDFRIALKPLSLNSCEISWNIPHDDVDMRILLDGKVAERTSSGIRCQILTVPVNQFHIISAEASSGGKWIRSANVAEFNTFQSCPAGECQIKETTARSGNGTVNSVDFSISIEGNIPPNAVGFVYAIRTRTEQRGPAPYLTRESLAEERNKSRISIEQYRRDGCLRYSILSRDEENYYLTLCTVYGDGRREVYSEPYRKKLARPLNAEIFWRVSSTMFQKPKLYIDIIGNRPFMRRPQLVLCASQGGGRLLSPSSPDARRLLSIPEELFSHSQISYQDEFPIKMVTCTVLLIGVS